MNFEAYENLEFEAKDVILGAQELLLREHLERCARYSPFYRERFESLRLDPAEFTLETLAEIPLTDKADLESCNDRFLAVPEEAVVDIVFSSGTTGRPTRIAYTERDLERLAYNERQSFAATGMKRGDTVLLTCTMDRCFVAGLAYYLGARSLGAATIRNGHGTLDGHAEIIRRVGPSVIIGVPSFLAKLADYLRTLGISPESTPVNKLICIGEPVRDRNMMPLPVGAALREKWDAAVYSTYASSEIVTTFCECVEENGGHLHPELAVVEIVDDTGCRLPVGEVGEVVVTPLGVEGMPLVRFRTGDLSFLIDAPCDCGRNTVRLGPILARRKQMLKLKGTTFYPQAIASALESLAAVEEHYVDVTRLDELSDHVVVHVAVSDPACTTAVIGERLQSRLRVTPEVVVEDLAGVRRRVFSPEYRKPMRFYDRRDV